MNNFTGCRGFSLLEVLVAMAMLSVAILMISTSLISSQRSLSRSAQRFEFNQKVDARAEQLICAVNTADCQGSGDESDDETVCTWQISSEDGLITLHLQGEQPRARLKKELEISKSAWLSRMRGPRE